MFLLKVQGRFRYRTAGPAGNGEENSTGALRLDAQRHTGLGGRLAGGFEPGDEAVAAGSARTNRAQLAAAAIDHGR
jgi:hypothetical protein